MLWDLFLIKKIAKKCNLWDRKQYTYALFTVDKVNNCTLKKKKEKNVEKKRKRGFQLKVNSHNISLAPLPSSSYTF